MAWIRFPSSMQRGYFKERLNRFVAIVSSESNELVKIHVPNSGRLRELLQERAEVWYTLNSVVSRKTRGDLMLVRDPDTTSMVSIDSRLPSRLLEKSLQHPQIKKIFASWIFSRREPAYGKGRFDLLFQKRRGTVTDYFWVETKSVTLAKDKTGFFPDTPTDRGSRHLKELIQLSEAGNRTAVFFIVQREDVISFSPNDHSDPLFGKNLREARRRGVEVYVYKCQVEEKGIKIVRSLPLQM